MTVDAFTAFNLGIIVFFIGDRLNRNIAFLREYNIPEPVSGGLIAAVVSLIIVLISGDTLTFDLGARDFLLLYFFTAIGLNARFTDLAKGGIPLLLLLALTIGFMIVQNLTGMGVAIISGLPSQVGVLGGTVSLIGGHGTAIAWAPNVAEDYGIEGAAEIGVACATLGLITASLVGGPIAKYLIEIKGARPAAAVEEPGQAIIEDEEDTTEIDSLNFMRAVLVLNVAIGVGIALNEAILQTGLKLPLFVTCLITGILMSNTVPNFFPRVVWPARTRALALISEIALGIFLSMSLMSLQLWTLAGLAGPLFVLIGVQVLVAVVFVIFVLFPLMGRDYDAAVLGAGFGGFVLGATPTAIANMTAVTKRFGGSTKAFLILPLVSAFFVDLANAVLIPFFLGLGQ